MLKRCLLLLLTGTIIFTSAFNSKVVMASELTTEEVTEEVAEEATEDAPENDTDALEVAKNGVVQINCIYTDDNNSRHIYKGSVGILIGSSEKDEYVLTSLERMQPTTEEKNAFLKSVGVTADNLDRAQLTYEVVIENDMTAQATLLNSSTDLDLAIFKLSQVLYNRTPMTFLYSSENDKSQYDSIDTAYALGFPDAIQHETNEVYYSNDRVNKVSGQLSNVINSGDSQLIEHKADVAENNVGGPLITADGEVIGMNVLKNEGNYSYAVSSNTLVKVLSGMGLTFNGVTFEDKAAEAEKIEKEKQQEADRKAQEERALQNNQKELMPGWVLPVIIALAVVVFIALIVLVIVVVLLVKKKNGVDGQDTKESVDTTPKYQFQPSIPTEFAGDMSSDTTVLGAASTPIASMTGMNMAAPSTQLNGGSLERKKNGENIAIVKSTFTMGKDDLHCDYCIRDNNTISRQHANIYVSGSTAYVEDNNSKNGTFLNGIMLVAGQRQELRDGDVIKLSNEEFVYRR